MFHNAVFIPKQVLSIVEFAYSQLVLGIVGCAYSERVFSIQCSNFNKAKFKQSILMQLNLELTWGQVLWIFWSTLTTWRGFVFSCSLQYIMRILYFPYVPFFSISKIRKIPPNNLICHSKLLCKHLYLQLLMLDLESRSTLRSWPQISLWLGVNST